MSIYKQEDNPQIISKPIEWLKAFWYRLTYRKQYRQFIQAAYHVFDITSLITTGPTDLEAESVFVELYLERQTPHHVEVGVLSSLLTQSKKDVDSTYTRSVIWDYLRTDQTRNLVILAGPGYGKTTLLKHVALTLIANIRKRWQLKLPNRLPVLLFLRDHVDSLKATQAILADAKQAIIPETYGQLREILLRSGPFESDQELRAIFVDQRIVQWRDEIPEATNPLMRVELLIDYLHNKINEREENALVLFLHVMRDRTDPTDTFYHRLDELAQKLDAELSVSQQNHHLHHTQTIFNRDFSLTQAIEDSVVKYGGAKVPQGWFASQLARGNCLVMLDALDEVGDSMTIRQVIAWMNHQMIAYPKNRFIVTARPHGFYQGELKNITALQVMNLDGDQIEQFVHNWYLASETVDAQTEVDLAQTRANEKAEDFLIRVSNARTLAEMAANPLLLTMMLYVHRYRSKLPERRVDLYAEAYQVLLGRRQEPVAMTASQKQRVLQPLAYLMTYEQQHELEMTQAVQAIHEPLTHYGNLSETSFLKIIEQISGLLLERNDQYSFAHSTFREYLTAVHIYEERLVEVLTTHVGHSWWHETIRLYCAMADVTPIVNACLSDDQLSDNTFQLALACLDEARNMRQDIEEKLERVLYRCLNNPHQKQIVGKALLNIQIGRMRPVTSRTDADIELITNAEYQVFLHEQREAGRYLQPDHWLSWQFPSGQARRPIIGVRPADAVAFCEWLNECEDSGRWHYRLPTKDEMQDKGFLKEVSTPGISYWVAIEEQWQCHGNEDLLITADHIQKYILEDVRLTNLSSATALFFTDHNLLAPARIVAQLGKFDFPLRKYRALLQQIRISISVAHPHAIAISKELASARAELAQTAQKYDEQLSQINQDIHQHQTEIEQLEGRRRELYQEVRTHYSSQYQKIEQATAEDESTIRKIKEQGESQRRQIQSDYGEQYNRIDQAIETARTRVTDLQDMRRQEERNERADLEQIDQQADEAIANVQTRIAELEDMRRQYEDPDRRIDQAIAQHRAQIKNYEDQRRNLQTQIRTDYGEQYGRIDEAIDKGEAHIAELNNVRRQYESNEQSAYGQLDNQVKQFCKEAEDHIREVERVRKKVQTDEREEHNYVDSQVNQAMAPIQEQINQLKQHVRDYKAEAEIASKRATELSRLLDHLPTRMQQSLNQLSIVEAESQTYFAKADTTVFALAQTVKECWEESQKLIDFIQAHFPSAVDFIDALKMLRDSLQQTRNEIGELVRLVDLRQKLLHAIETTCTEVRDIQLIEVQTSNISQMMAPELIVSFKSAYNFLLNRAREFAGKSSQDDQFQRIQYARLCTFAVAGNILAQENPITSLSHLQQYYLALYMKLCILESRMRGELSAFEGIRIVREKV